MYIFNLTFLVAESSADKWLTWVKSTHIPFMLSSNLLSNPQLVKVLNNQGQDGTSYSVQFHAATMSDLEDWNQRYAHELQQQCTDNFGEEVLFFSTVLELM